MDMLMVVLRLVHIFAGVYWVGTGFFMLLFFEPTMQSLGETGTKFMRALYTRTKFGASMGSASLLTILSGIWLYWKISNGFDADWMKSENGIVLSIGVLAGLSAFGHGAATLGRKGGEFAVLAEAIQANKATPEQTQQEKALLDYLSLHSRIGFVMMIVALAGMASARYV